MGWRSGAASAPTTPAITLASTSTWQPTRRGFRAHRRPGAGPPGAPAAVAWASASMNIMATRLTAIEECPAGRVPSRAMKKAMKVKPVTSTGMEPPMGTPSLMSARSAFSSGRLRCSGFDGKGQVGGVAAQQHDGGHGLHRHRCRRGPAAARHPEGRHGPGAKHQHGIERHLQQQSPAPAAYYHRRWAADRLGKTRKAVNSSAKGRAKASVRDV